MKKLILFFALFLILASPSRALIQNLSVSFSVLYGDVYVDESIAFDAPTNYTIMLPSDARTVSVYLDGALQNETPAAVFARTIRTTYLTKDYLQNTNFLADIPYPDDVQNLSVRLTLAQNLALSKPVDYSTMTSNAVFPRPTRLETDGQRLSIIWERQELQKGEDMSIFVSFTQQPSYTYFIFGAVIVLVIAGAVLALILRKPKVRIVEKEIVKTEIEKHLKEDEAQVVNILKQREGQVEQGTLRVITGFSKAKLSGLLKELEDRNVIYKEKRGKKNLVFLRK